MEQVTVTTTRGQLAGVVTDEGVRRFLGIGYAEPPVGNLRGKLPVRRRSWEGVRDATRFGATAPQAAGTGPLAELLPRHTVSGDDYLNLNIWAPATGTGHPVMVFIHGGSWTSGAGSVGGYDGSRFARDDVVLVTLNYRLGAEGFAWFGDGDANLALHDQLAALTWVQEEIEAFGGDAGNVTVFGESSGAMSIGALLAMPAAAGLFRRAVLQSGSVMHTISAASAHKVARRMARILNVPATAEGLAGVPENQLLEAQNRIASEISRRPLRLLWGDVAANGLAFEPVVDGDSLPRRPLEALRAGVSNDVDLLVGWNTEEANLVLAPSGVDRVRPWLLYPLALRTGLPLLRGPRAYRDIYAGQPAHRAVGALMTDWLYRIPAIRTAEAHPNTRLYEFTWPSPAFGANLGACHGIELPFVFDNLDHPDWAQLVGANPPQTLADEVHRAWVGFARDGDPGWTAYRPGERSVHRFGSGTPEDSSRTLNDPDPERRLAWDSIR